MNRPVKDQSSVFLLTLVDFLFQIIFFGLFFAASYAAVQARDDAPAANEIAKILRQYSTNQIARILEALRALKDPANAKESEKQTADLFKRYGVSNFVELSDKLSKMVPAEQVAVLKDDLDKLKDYKVIVDKAGGPANVATAVDIYRRGVGKPHCLSSDGGKTAIPLGTLIAYDDRIEVEQSTQELQKVLAKIGKTIDDVRLLKLDEFSNIYSQLRSDYPDCMHSFRFRERTELIHARNAMSRTGVIRPIFVK